uniref:Gag/pol protein n=1 Tax=Davidia involucrata TaxID=16924 RepID=A0A5B6Z3G1_DAVIN
MNFNMNKMAATLPELVNMLTTAEGTIKKTKGSAFVVEAFTSKSKFKGKKKWKGKKPQLKAKGGIKKDKTTANDKGKCFHYGRDAHWKRNCREYLTSKKESPSEGSKEKQKAE